MVPPGGRSGPEDKAREDIDRELFAAGWLLQNREDLIARAVGECFSIAQASEQGVAVSLTRIARLRQSILKWAFEGRLVDQDPNDEPASVLLERIGRERAVGEGASVKRRVPKRQARG